MSRLSVLTVTRKRRRRRRSIGCSLIDGAAPAGSQPRAPRCRSRPRPRCDGAPPALRSRPTSPPAACASNTTSWRTGATAPVTPRLQLPIDRSLRGGSLAGRAVLQRRGACSVGAHRGSHPPGRPSGPDEIWDEAARHYDEQALVALVVAIASRTTLASGSVTKRLVWTPTATARE